jgi:hypothetical protein
MYARMFVDDGLHTDVGISIVQVAYQETYNLLGALDYLKVPDRLVAFDSQTFSRQPRSATIKS